MLWDGLVHAWLQDLLVAADRRREGIAKAVVDAATDGARAAGCDLLHVDFDEDLAGFYLGACGFARTSAGLKPLR